MTRHAVETYLSLIDQIQERIQVEEKPSKPLEKF